jgi:hypothetical protein
MCLIQLTGFLTGEVYPRHNSLFDFGTIKPFAGFCQRVKIKRLAGEITFLQMNGKNVASLRLSWKIDKKDLIHSTLANQFRRKGGDLI